jgi:hypothetical protein
MSNDEGMSKSIEKACAGHFAPNSEFRISNFKVISSFVIRALSFPNLLADHLFLLGARVSLLSADQAALKQFDQSIIH